MSKFYQSVFKAYSVIFQNRCLQLRKRLGKLSIYESISIKVIKLVKKIVDRLDKLKESKITRQLVIT